MDRMIDPRKTGAYIAKLRREKDWTQLELADKLHVTHQAVSRWETGDSFPDVGTLAHIAQLFGVRVDDLLNGEHVSGSLARRVTTGAVLDAIAQGHPEEVARLVKDEKTSFESVI